MTKLHYLISKIILTLCLITTFHGFASGCCGNPKPLKVKPWTWVIIVVGTLASIYGCYYCCCRTRTRPDMAEKTSQEPDHPNHAQRHHQSNNPPDHSDNYSNNVAMAVVQPNPGQFNSIQPAPYGYNPRLGKIFHFYFQKMVDPLSRAFKKKKKWNLFF